MVVELYPHQREAVEQLANGKILCGGVGTGKTITSLVYFYEKVCGGTLGDLDSLDTPVDLYVITTAKKRDAFDWQEDAAKLCLTADPGSSVGCIRLTVDSWNNIDKYSEVENAFFIFDEQRVVGSGAWYKSFIKIAKSNRWILLSATPGDTWLDYIAVFVANGFVKNRTEFKRNHCVYSYYGRFPKLERYLEPGKLVRWRNQLLVDMPYERHTTRHVHEIEVDYDRDLFDMVVKKRWHVYENRPIRDVSEMFSVMRKVVNSDKSRMSRLRDLLAIHPKVIVFYNFDYELEELRTLASPESKEFPGTISPASKLAAYSGPETRSESFERVETNGANTNEQLLNNGVETTQTMDEATKRFGEDEPWMKQKFDESSERRFRPESSKGIRKHSKTSSQETPNGYIGVESHPSQNTVGVDPVQVAEWNGHKHEPIPKTDRWVYLVQYVAGAEGWNCIDTDAMVFYSLTYSYKNFHQAQGRIDRLNTPFSDLHYYILKSKSMIDKAIGKALANKKSFNEREFVGNSVY